MVIKRLLSLTVFCAAWALPAGACLSGWDCCKWNDPDHQTPKYVVGRAIAAFPHTPDGLKQALPIINGFYPGTKILPGGKGDKVHIPCVGVVDLIVAAGGAGGGQSWWWGAEAADNECGKCKPNRCEEVSQSRKCGNPSAGAGAGAGTGAGVGEAGSGYGGAAGNCAGVRVPNRLSVVQQTAADNPDAWSAKLNPNEHECRVDSRYLDMVVDNLRKEDKRWGFNCKRGNCNDPSHDVVAYYFGQGQPYEGAPQVMLVDMIQNTCAPDARPNWLVLEANFGNGSGAGWTSKGRFAGGPRQNVVMNCPPNGAPPTAEVAPIGGGGGSSSSGPRSGPPKAASKRSDDVIGGSRGKAPPVSGPGAAEDAPAHAPAAVPEPGAEEEEEEAH